MSVAKLQKFIKDVIHYNKVVQVAIVVIGGSILRTLCCYVHRRYKQYPPGPNGLPFFGSFFSFINVPKFTSYLSSNFGGISMVYIGSQPFVFLHSIKYINEIMKNKNALDRGWDNSLLYSHLNPHEIHTAAVSEKYWLKKRKMLQAVMATRLDSNFIAKVHNKSLEYTFKVIDKCIEENKLWYPAEYTSYIQFHLIFNAVYGTYLEFDSIHIKNMVNLITNAFTDAGYDIVIRYLGLIKLLPQSYKDGLFPNYRLFSNYIEKQLYEQLNYDQNVFDMNDKKWEKHFNDVRKDKNSCVASKVFAYHRSDPHPLYSAKQAILSEFNVFFLAGVDTTMHTSEYGIILLAKNPNVQEQIYNEVKPLIGNDSWRLETTHFPKIFGQLHYLRAFTYELLRISSVIPNASHYNSKGDIWLKNGKYRIPQGSVILTDIPFANRNDPYWKKKINGDTMNLCLDAWLDKNHHFKLNLNKDKMVGFGVGPRECAGMAMATRSLYLLFLKLILNYRFALENKDKNSKIHQKYQFTFVMNPKIGVIATQRDSIL